MDEWIWIWLYEIEYELMILNESIYKDIMNPSITMALYMILIKYMWAWLGVGTNVCIRNICMYVYILTNEWTKVYFNSIWKFISTT